VDRYQTLNVFEPGVVTVNIVDDEGQFKAQHTLGNLLSELVTQQSNYKNYTNNYY